NDMRCFRGELTLGVHKIPFRVFSSVSPASRIFPIDFEYVDRVEGMESRCRVPGELFQSRNLSRFEICEGESSFLRSKLPVRDLVSYPRMIQEKPRVQDGQAQRSGVSPLR